MKNVRIPHEVFTDGFVNSNVYFPASYFNASQIAMLKTHRDIKLPMRTKIRDTNNEIKRAFSQEMFPNQKKKIVLCINKSHNTFVKEQKQTRMYIFTQLLYHEKDATQSQFFSRVQLM